MVHPLDGVQAKLDRAFEHGEALRDEIRGLVQGDFYDTRVEYQHKPDAKGNIWLRGYLDVLQEPPLKLGVMAGDCVHNLRSALDHLVYQLALLDGEKSPSGTLFPIACTEAEYLVVPPNAVACLRDRALAGIAEPHRAMIDQEQPYISVSAGSHARDHALAVLNSFWNRDKHRVIQTAALRPFSVEAIPVGANFTPIVHLPAKPPRVLANGAYIYSIGTPALDPSVKVQVNLNYGIGFGHWGVTDADLLNLCVYVGDLIDRFRPLFS